MKNAVCCISIVLFLFVSAANTFGYIGHSIRIMGFGDELSGVVRDEYTDIYRNPAYLSLVKRVRVFGQNNLLGRTELRIAPQITNKQTGLVGLVLPIPDLGNLALVSEIKSSTSEDHPKYTDRKDYFDQYTITTDSKDESYKESIVNFKAIYSRRLSSSLLAGVDFVYLKNYHRRDYETYSANIKRSNASDDLISESISEYGSHSDDSPDAQRMSFGVFFDSWKEKTLDFTFYYERLSYTKRSSSAREYNLMGFAPDTSSDNRINWSCSSGPVKDWALGLDVNFKRDLTEKTILVLLFGGSYQEKMLSWSEQSRDTSFSSPDYSTLNQGYSSMNYEDEGFSLMLGMGFETRFAFNILDIADVLANDLDGACTLGVACKSYWDRDKLDHHRWSEESNLRMLGDSIIYSVDNFGESKIKKTVNSYKLSFPIGVEFVLEKAIKIRFGGEFEARRYETETGFSTSSKSYYYQGLGLSYHERIYFDAYAENSLSHMSKWMARVEYRF